MRRKLVPTKGNPKHKVRFLPRCPILAKDPFVMLRVFTYGQGRIIYKFMVNICVNVGLNKGVKTKYISSNTTSKLLIKYICLIKER